tara:strand:+ start:325 stop:519 length:195 start_codon:yes stop_codon:yes gene_type:complete
MTEIDCLNQKRNQWQRINDIVGWSVKDISQITYREALKIAKEIGQSDSDIRLYYSGKKWFVSYP